eukprot:1159699-Pelagomonas_calceolata.AAC.12
MEKPYFTSLYALYMSAQMKITNEYLNKHCNCILHFFLISRGAASKGLVRDGSGSPKPPGKSED